MERTAKRQKKELNYNDGSDDDDFQNEEEMQEDEETTEVANVESPIVSAHKEKFVEHEKFATIKDMMVRQIIKENHGKEITQLAMNYSDPRFSNMVATTGDCQVC